MSKFNFFCEVSPKSRQYNNYYPMKILTYFCSISLLLGALACTPFPIQSPQGNNSPKPANAPSTTQRFAKMNFRHQVIEDRDSLRVWLELEIPRLEKSNNFREALQKDFDFNYGILDSYTSQEFVRKGKILNINQYDIIEQNNRFYASFNIAKRPIISEVMVLEIIDQEAGQKVIKDILLNYTVTKDRERFRLFEADGKVPLFRNYILNDEAVQIRNLYNEKTRFFVSYFSENFPPAKPPMSNQSNLSVSLPQADSSFQVQSHESLRFERPGLYWLQSDTTQFFGISVFVAERKYPKLSKIQSLRKPLIYITTKEEIDSLEQSQDYKATKEIMDKLWLKLTMGNVKIAKQTIKAYYERVKLANEFFTTHKAGWKTDMGMIFIIFGSPNRVVRTESKELWTYTQSATFSEINFTFVRKPSQFSDQHYSLIRYPEYEEIWYPTIERWREGKL